MKKMVMLLLAMAAPAMAITDGWDATDEVMEREWTNERVAWARAIHPDSPSYSEIVNDAAPPPREMWCTDDPWPEQCDAWEAQMDVWLHYYLEIPYDEPLPSALAPFPKECESSCNVY